MESMNILKIIYIIIIILLEKAEQWKCLKWKKKITGDNIVVKMDFTEKKKSYVQKEYEIFKQLVNINNIPILYDYWSDSKYI